MYGKGGAYINFPQHGEADTVVKLAELLDLIVAAGVLAAELVAGKADDLEVVGVLRLQVLVEFLKPGELRGEAAFGGGVDDEDDFAVQVRQRVLGAALWIGVLVGEKGMVGGAVGVGCGGFAEGRARGECVDGMGWGWVRTYCLWA